MITHSKSLLRKVEVYLKKISKPCPELGGHPICPSLAGYRHAIMVVGAKDDLEEQIHHISDLLIPLNIPAAIIVTTLPPRDLWDITDKCMESKPWVEVFINDPTLKGKHRGVYTGFEDGYLIIIQRTDLLDLARNEAKISGYYNQKTKHK